MQESPPATAAAGAHPTRLVFIVPVLAVIAGAAIGYVDSRSGWDDTGVTVGSIFLVSAILAAVRPRSAWLVGLGVGFPVLAFNVGATGNFGSAVALVIGVAGAGVGRLVSRAMDHGDARQ